MPLPLVSVIIPTHNEALYIERCLFSVLRNRYPHTRLEILVVDGQSNDRTKDLVKKISATSPIIQLIDNPHRTVPYAMNIGIRAAKGDVIIRMDAHAHYDRQYIPLLVEWLEKLQADNVGGVWVTHPGANTREAQAVAAVLSHPFGIGNAHYRLGIDAPMEVDTVPFGCYRREVFERIGLYDERFTRNQDDELNARLKRHGGKIYLIPGIRIDYYARERMGKMATMLYQYGYFKPLVGLVVGKPATLRQFAPPLFVLALVGLPLAGLGWRPFWYLWGAMVLAHSALNLRYSLKLAGERGSSLVPWLFRGFLTAHLAYGWGYLRGIVDFALLRKHRQPGAVNIGLSR